MTESRGQSDCQAIPAADAAAWAATLEQQRRRIDDSGLGNRPWMYWELHNPWSRSAACVDAWAVLDVCQAPRLIDLLAAAIGGDIVLFDSQLLPNPPLARLDRPRWRSDAEFFPLDGPGGIVARIPFGPPGRRTFEYRGRVAGCLEHEIGSVILHPADVEYRSTAADGGASCEYVIRYYEATRHFIRDPADPRQLRLTERYPWINYARMPHWLVRGEDRADNDFVTGFRVRAGRWTLAPAPELQ